MSRQCPRQSGAPRVMLLSVGLALVSNPTAWAADVKLGAPGPLLSTSQSWPQATYAERPQLTEAAFQEHGAPLERAGTRSFERSLGTDGERVNLPATAAPQVEVRVGDHGAFERIAFEWPEPIECDVVQHAEQVTIAFSRPGRIDVSRITDRLHRVADAWAENGDAMARVTLRVLPNTRVRSLNLKDGRVAIDLLGGAVAQRVAPPAPGPEHDMIRELRRALEQRDAVIGQRDAAIEQLRSQFDQLAARFERLERTIALSSGDLDRVTAGHAGPMPWVGNTPGPQARSPSVAAVEAPASQPSGDAPAVVATPATTEQQPATTSQGQSPESTGVPARRETAQSQAPAPGQVEVDEEAAERALDFTLVQEGALLLPFGRAEFTPSFTYTRRANDFPVVLGPAGNQVIAEEEVRRNEFNFFASLLLGLPLDSQLELGLPYNLVDQSVANQVGGAEVEESSDTGHGLGDFSVGLAKTVLRERNWWPDVVFRVNWDTGTGERTDNDVVLDGGFQELTGSVSLVKRQDPLVFVGGAFYEAAFEEDDIDPGDTLGFTTGTFLAASPSTSLRLVLSQSFIDEFKVDGRSIDGSETVQSILTLGASAILSPNVLLDGAVGVGLTDDSPDYSVSVSLPIRFSTPGF
jgi:hypothetical protein